MSRLHKNEEVLIDTCNLDPKTEKLVAKAIFTSFSEYKLNIGDCKLQTYVLTFSTKSEF